MNIFFPRQDLGRFTQCGLTTSKTYTVVSNLFDLAATAIAKLYKNRMEIEPFFEQLKQNFELKAFYSNSQERIKTPVWIAMIANFIFTVIQRQIKEAELFSALVQMARANLGLFLRFIDVLKIKNWRGNEKNIEIIQFDLFKHWEGVVLKT